MEVDSCFREFERWSGNVPAGFQMNFLGARNRESYLTDKDSGERQWTSEYPPFDEEYFEWVDLLEAVLGSGDEFVMVELGAGFGRWSVNGAKAAAKKGKKFRIVAVEAESKHFSWLEDNMKENGLEPSTYELHRAAVSARDGEAEFYHGDSRNWYGQRLSSANDNEITITERMKGIGLKKVKTISLSTLLADYPRVDLIDMDIQGAEFDVLSSSQDILNRQVKRVHIGTHGTGIEVDLRVMFDRMGWQSRFDFHSGKESDTPYGRIYFQDGVQSWTNPRITDLQGPSPR